MSDNTDLNIFLTCVFHCPAFSWQWKFSIQDNRFLSFDVGRLVCVDFIYHSVFHIWDSNDLVCMILVGGEYKCQFNFAKMQN